MWSEDPVSIERVAYQSSLPVSRQFAWSCCVRPGMFERLTPPWQGLRTVSTSGTVKPGDRRVMELAVGSVKIHWVAVHEQYDEGRLFTDRQIRGPFRRWRHRHLFLDEGESECRIRDEIEFALPASPISHPLGLGIARTELRRLFRYRHFTTLFDVREHYSLRDRDRRSVHVSGAPIEAVRQLQAFLQIGGHQVGRDDPAQADRRVDRITVSGDYSRGLTAEIVRGDEATGEPRSVKSARIIDPEGSILRAARAAQFFDFTDSPLTGKIYEWSTVDDFVASVHRALVDANDGERRYVQHPEPFDIEALLDAASGGAGRTRLGRPHALLVRRLEDELRGSPAGPEAERPRVLDSSTRFRSLGDALRTMTGNAGRNGR
ncbi:hypothetical protein BH23CHL2_BH23CHL2_03870 [soil metagenome]